MQTGSPLCADWKVTGKLGSAGLDFRSLPPVSLSLPCSGPGLAVHHQRECSVTQAWPALLLGRLIWCMGANFPP